MTATNKKPEQKKTNSDTVYSTICLPDHDARIAELAYYKSEKRKFALGYELNDWLEAEQEYLL